MVKNFSNLVREIDTQIQEAQSTKQDEPKEAHTKIKYKDRILKAARKKKKQLPTREPHMTISWFLKRNFAV